MKHMKQTKNPVLIVALILGVLFSSASAAGPIKFSLDDLAFDYFSPNTAYYNHSSDRYGKTGYVSLAYADGALTIRLSDEATPGSLSLGKTLAHLPLARPTGVEGEYVYTRAELRDYLPIESYRNGWKIVYRDTKLSTVTDAYHAFFTEAGFVGNETKTNNSSTCIMTYVNGEERAKVVFTRIGSEVTVYMTSF